MFIKVFSSFLAIFFCGNFIMPDDYSNSGFHIIENEKLSEFDKAEVEEFFNLKRQLGDSVWPGFGKADIPVILYNKDWAYLVGYNNPPDGWSRVPAMNQYGRKWELVTGEKIAGRNYYRQRIDSNNSPQAFTVKVGEKWVASMTTIKWTRQKLENGIKKNMPSAEKDSSLLKKMVDIMGGNPDKHISMIVHESFHAFQAIKCLDRLKESESMFTLQKQYPSNDDFNKAWKNEFGLLIKAFETKNERDAKQLIKQYLQLRTKRYSDSKLRPGLIRYEQLKEWEEGIAKYIELSLWKSAGSSSVYIPSLPLKNDPSFEQYKKFEQAMSRELMTCRMQPQGDDTRFYYSGMMQAFLLDRFLPGWKLHAFDIDIFPDMLLGRISE